MKNLSIFSMILFVALAHQSRANDDKNSVKVSKTVYLDLKSSRTPDIRITNKYGKIAINTWDKDSVKMLVEIVASAKQEKDAKEILERVEITYTHAAAYLTAVTEIDKEKSMISEFINGLISDARNLIDKSNLEVNYTIYAPATASIMLDNKFGDVFLDGDMRGRLRITVSHGILHSNNDLSAATLNLSFGKIYAKGLERCQIKTTSTQMHARNLDNSILESTSTDLDADTVKNLTITSRNDKINFLYVNELSGSSSFSTFNINKMFGQMRLSMQYGELKITALQPDFGLIDIQSQSADIQILADARTNYHLEKNDAPKKNNNTNGGFSLIQSLNSNNNAVTNSFQGNANQSNKPQPNLIRINAKGGQVIVK